MDFSIQSGRVETFDALDNQVIDWGVSLIRAPVNWRTSRGEGMKIAVLDTGCDKNHDDISENIVAGRNFTTANPEDWDDAQGHGTHCAGVISATDNARGVVGVAPKASLYIGKVLADNGHGSIQMVIDGIDWAIECDVDIISMSLGTARDPGSSFHSALKRARKAGIVIIAASGNENGDVGWPAAYDEVLAVGAMDNTFERAPFSNTGEEMDIIAPGVDILSTYPKNRYAKLSGTSMATPLVSGVAALIQSIARKHGQKATPEYIFRILSESALDLGGTGHDHEYGHGLINVSRIIDSIENSHLV